MNTKRPKAKLSNTVPADAQVIAAESALGHLIRAREEARRAGAAYTLPRIEAAISSCRGAIRGAKLRARKRGA